MNSTQIPNSVKTEHIAAYNGSASIDNLETVKKWFLIHGEGNTSKMVTFLLGNITLYTFLYLLVTLKFYIYL